MDIEKHSFKLILISQAITSIGTSISMIAFAYIVTHLTQSVQIMSIVFSCKYLPCMFSPWISTWVESINLKLSVIFADLIQAFLLILLIAWLSFSSHLYQELYLIVFLMGVVDTFYNAANARLLPSYFQKTDYLPNNGKISSATNLMSGVGYLIGGVLIARLNPIYSIVVELLTCLISAVVLSQLPITYCYQITIKNWKEFFHESAKGIKYISKSHMVIFIIITFFIITLLTTPLEVIIPFKFFSHGAHSIYYSLFVITILLGTLIGNQIILNGMQFLSTTSTISFSWFGLAICMLILSTTEVFFWFLIIAFFIGLFSALIDTLVITLLQLIVPKNLRARAFSSFELIINIAPPLSFVMYAYSSKKIPFNDIFLIVGFGCILVSLIWSSLYSLKIKMDEIL